MQLFVNAGRNYCKSKTTSTDLQKVEVKKAYEAKTKSIDGFV